MCKFNLNNIEEAKKWILVNHPDKADHPDHDPNITEEIYKENYPMIRDCIKNEKFCGVQEKKIKVTKKKSC